MCLQKHLPKFESIMKHCSVGYKVFVQKKYSKEMSFWVFPSNTVPEPDPKGILYSDKFVSSFSYIEKTIFILAFSGSSGIFMKFFTCSSLIFTFIIR